MEYKSFEALGQRAGSLPKKTVVLAAAQDEHALEAVLTAAGEGMIRYLLVGDGPKIREVGRALGHDVPAETIVDADGDVEAATKAVALVREGQGDFLMKGRLETATLLRAVLNRETGIRTGRIMSHVSVLEAPSYHKLLAVTDAGTIPHPTLEQKEMIVRNALALFWALGYETPKIALLAASETVNERQPETGEAGALADMAREGKFGSCVAAGPISFDLAISAESARIKGYRHPVVADPDILVTPDMASGNILTKSMLYMGGAKMAGCVMGARAPIILTSRGATAEEKRLSILLAAVVADAGNPR